MTRAEAAAYVEGLPLLLHSLSDGQKEVIRTIVSDFGVEGVNLRGNCPNCWQDAVLVLRNFFGVTSGDVDGDGVVDDTNAKWRFKGDHPLMWRGHLIDAHTDEDVIEQFVQFHPKFFEQL